MASRRGANEGSIYRRTDGRWVAVLHVGYAAGRRERKAYYGATRQEVASLLAVAVRERQQGKRPVPEREKVGPFLKRWLNDIAKRSIRPSTYAGYERTIRLHIEPEVGDRRLARLTADDLDTLYSRLLKKGLAPATVKQAHAVLHKALSHAQKRGALAVNIADNVDPPRIPKLENHVVLLPEEVVRLFDAASGDRFSALYVLALTCGMRQAELLGLRWRDVDLGGAVLAVRQQVYRIRVKWEDSEPQSARERKTEWVYSEPKTAKGRRTISLTAAAVASLREHRLRQNEERLKSESPWEDNDLVFPNRCGGPMAKESLLRWSFWPLLKRAGLPDMRFHDLRHTAATLLLSDGVHPKVVQERLGHSSIAVTMDVYSHVMPTLQRDAAERLDRLLAAR